MLCEECGENEAEKDAIVDGMPMKLCGKCASVSSGIVINKPSQGQVDESKRMWRVKEILSRSAGIPYAQKPVNLPSTLRTVSLEDLRRVDKDKKSAYQLRHEGRMSKEAEESASQKSNQAEKLIEDSKDFKD
jgi:hypothetical protein